jgi:hypothetical protein
MRSDYFKRLLEGNTVEARTGIIHLEDMRSDTMKKFVYFMNVGTFVSGYNTLEELYELAYRYESDQLKVACKSKYLSSMGMDYLLDSLRIGFIYDDLELKGHAIDKLKRCYSPPSSLCYFKTIKWIKFAATDLRLALKIKVAAYKAGGILAENYEL